MTTSLPFPSLAALARYSRSPFSPSPFSLFSLYTFSPFSLSSLSTIFLSLSFLPPCSHTHTLSLFPFSVLFPLSSLALSSLSFRSSQFLMARRDAGGARKNAERPCSNTGRRRSGVGRLRPLRHDALSEPDVGCVREDCRNVLEGLADDIRIGESHSSQLPPPLPLPPGIPSALAPSLLPKTTVHAQPELSVSSASHHARVPHPPLRGALRRRQDRSQHSAEVLDLTSMSDATLPHYDVHLWGFYAWAAWF